MRKGVNNLLKRKTKILEFKAEIGQVFKDSKRDLIITNREYRMSKNGQNLKWYKYTCNVCKWTEGWLREYHLFQYIGCSCCANQTVIVGINDIPTTTPWMVKYFQGGIKEAELYTKSSSKRILPICPDCGRVSNTWVQICRIHIKKAISCTCSDKISYPNKFSYSLLEQLNEIYGFEYLEHEYSPNWIGRKSYDNYFIHNGKEYILEMDGGFHSIDNLMSGQTKEISKEIDDYKDKMARENGIEVIRVNCDKSELDHIKQNILESKLCNIFCLNDIDWLKAEEFSLSNLCKVACDYKNNNPDMTTNDIANIMRLNRKTIKGYLKKGKLLKWCIYYEKEEKRKASSKNGKANSKPVGIFKDGIRLHILPSCRELEKQSEVLFGIKLLQSGISNVCNGKRPHHKGFTFKYINENEQAI